MSKSAAELLDCCYRTHPVPPGAHVTVTRRCNADCVHCLQVVRSTPELTTTEWELVFERLAQEGVLILTLSGGEPSLRPDFLDLVRSARSLGFSVTVKTNGIALDSGTCEALASAAVTSVHLSLYAVTPEIHEKITRVPGSHARTLAAARCLAANGTKVRLACPLMDINFDGFRDLVDLADREGFLHVLDPSMQLCENGCEQPGMRPLGQDELVRFFSSQLDVRSATASPVRGRAVE